MQPTASDPDRFPLRSDFERRCVLSGKRVSGAIGFGNWSLLVHAAQERIGRAPIGARGLSPLLSFQKAALIELADKLQVRQTFRVAIACLVERLHQR